MNDKNRDKTLEELLTELGETDASVKSALIYRLSDLDTMDIAVIKSHWQSIPDERRLTLFSRLAETSETNFEVDFTAISLFALNDEDPEVRMHAIGTLWFNNDPEVMRRFIRMLETDESSDVRAAAAEALGNFVLSGELGDLPEAVGHEAEEALLAALNIQYETLLVHRRALESLAYSEREEVPDLILSAYEHNDIGMQASAVFSMGRSADDRWKRNVIEGLDSAVPEIRYEAARAAGELGLSRAISRLMRMAEETSDREIQQAAIWSLGEIGGTEAQNALLRLANHEIDEDLLEGIEDAISMAQLASGSFSAIIFGDDDEIEDMVEFDELDDEDEDY